MSEINILSALKGCGIKKCWGFKRFVEIFITVGVILNTNILKTQPCGGNYFNTINLLHIFSSNIIYTTQNLDLLLLKLAHVLKHLLSEKNTGTPLAFTVAQR